MPGSIVHGQCHAVAWHFSSYARALSKLVMEDPLEGSQEGNSLNGFAEPHLISQDDMLPLLPGKVQPVEAL